MLIFSQQLSEAALEAVEQLVKACRKIDKANIPVYPQLLATYRPGPPNLLYYQAQNLIGFLAAFQFYPDAVEVAVLIHPNYRRQGIAKKLWQTIYPKLKLLALKDFILSSPHNTPAPWLTKHPYQLISTEYDMICVPHAISPSLSTEHIIIRATENELDSLYRIDSACFHENRTEPILRIKSLLGNPNIQIFLLLHQNKPIGQVHLVFEPKQVRITDLAILPHMQQQGLGKQLLNYCINYIHASHQKRISLTVASTNTVALRLYQSMGFKICNAIDYYKHGFSLDRF